MVDLLPSFMLRVLGWLVVQVIWHLVVLVLVRFAVQIGEDVE
jgi:hypothetical protein